MGSKHGRPGRLGCCRQRYCGERPLSINEHATVRLFAAHGGLLGTGSASQRVFNSASFSGAQGLPAPLRSGIDNKSSVAGPNAASNKLEEKA